MQTLFDITKEQRQSEAVERRGAHNAALVKALGDGRDWEYTGDYQELPQATGVCACGHIGLRHLFMIRNTKNGNTAIVGSSCIETFQSANPEMVERIRAEVAELHAKSEDRKRAARELTREREIQAALDEFDAVAWELDTKLAPYVTTFTYKCPDGSPAIGYSQTKRVGYTLWRYWHGCAIAAERVANRQPGARYPHRWKQYKSKPAFLKHIRAEIDRVKYYLSRPLFDAS